MTALLTWHAEGKQFICQGQWCLANIKSLQSQVNKMPWPEATEITIDGAAVNRLDTAGAWLIMQYIKKLQAGEIITHLKNFNDAQQKLLSLIEGYLQTPEKLPKQRWPFLARVGAHAIWQMQEGIDFLQFIGQLSVQSWQVLWHPKRWRLNALTSVIDKSGYMALPIIALLSFMIGVVLAYQLGVQLRSYGANIYIVDLLGLSVLREFGPLLTAILVAGRTGSAFTAQLGTMKIKQEMDALNTMGVTPAELLIIPRIIGLVVALPLLTIWANIFGILGGMVMAEGMLGISWHDFLNRFQHEVPLSALLIGLGKTPIFALLIASIGCFEGLRVKENAESIGTQTTKSVVLSIFFIIVADAIFSIIFSRFNL